MTRSIIEELGRAVLGRWQTKGYREWEFASIAATVLDEFNLHKEVGAVLDHAFLANEGSFMQDHRSQDVAGLLSTAHFSVCLHTWVDGLAPMHHHAWSGAYQILQGISVEARYSFREDRRLAAGFSVGELSCHGIDELSPGATRLVEPGKSHIHTMSYIDQTSLTLSLRTRPIFGETTSDYWRPGVAIETLGAADYITARNKCLRYLAYADAPLLFARLRVWISSGDLRSIFHGLEALSRLPARIGAVEWDELLEIGRAVHGSIFETIAVAAAEAGRPQYYRRLLARMGAAERDMRRFLSYLFVAPGREFLVHRLGLSEPRHSLFQSWRQLCHRILELDAGEAVVAEWKQGVLVVLDNLLKTGSTSAAMEDVANSYDVDENTMSLVRQTCDHLRRHPALGLLAGN